MCVTVSQSFCWATDFQSVREIFSGGNTHARPAELLLLQVWHVTPSRGFAGRGCRRDQTIEPALEARHLTVQHVRLSRERHELPGWSLRSKGHCATKEGDDCQYQAHP